MDGSTRLWLYLLLAPIGLAFGQGQQCYFGPGAAYRADSSVIPCNDDGPSTCCMQGDTCLSGNACYDWITGDTYQYGCTDITYRDATCPFKCGWNATLSPWTALEYCDADGVDNTWVCHSPESCGCEWTATPDLLELPGIRGCTAMGSDARAALYAPGTLVPWVSLPKTPGGTTHYYSTYTTDGTFTWVSTAILGYTPSSIGPYTTYKRAAPTSVVVLFPGSTPEPSTLGKAHLPNVTPTPGSISSLSSSLGSTGSTSSSITSHTSTSSTSSTSKTSSTTSSSSPTHTTSPSLTTGAKVGIGVGVAGGVCLLAAIALVSIIFRRRRRAASDGSGPDEKYASWQGQPYPPGGSPHGYHYNNSYQYQGVPAMIHEGPYSPEDERTIQKRLSPLQPPPPVEMDGHYRVPEADSRESSRPNLAQNYEQTDIAKQASSSSA